MRIGLVNFLNARPLDYAFRRNPKNEIVESSPAKLCQLILAGDLDCALISSVECLRNQDKLDWYKKLGICSHGEVRSVLYIRKKGEGREEPIERLWSDSASRSSLALWQCLYFQIHKKLPPIEKLEASQIPEYIYKSRESGAILIGDAALRFSQSENAKDFAVYDLGAWWSSQENLPFVFALWAYPQSKASLIEESLFEDSFAQGKANMKKIIASSRIEDTESYLQKNIYYRLGKTEHRALARFQECLEEKTNI